MEAKIQSALVSIRNKSSKSIKEAARQYQVPYERLRMRFHGREPYRGGQNKKLSEPQEEAVKLFLDRCIALGRPSKKRYIRQAANSILRAVTDAPKTIAVSKDWSRRFIKRNPPIPSTQNKTSICRTSSSPGTYGN